MSARTIGEAAGLREAEGWQAQALVMRQSDQASAQTPRCTWDAAASPPPCLSPGHQSPQSWPSSLPATGAQPADCLGLGCPYFAPFTVSHHEVPLSAKLTPNSLCPDSLMALTGISGLLPCLPT